MLFGLSEAAVVAAALSAETSRAALFLAATAGNVLGALVNFALGRFAIRFEDRRWFPVSRHARQKAETLFARYGRPVLLFSWLPIVGDPLTLAAGLLRTPLGAFLVYVTIGKAARYAALLWLTP
ncbi:YqaA family protein [Sinorhizobium fredii]|nr:VTT domain-containing protein [Sinorhizobium fredii]WOS64539.1 VTT domain-containing protein [Sinorhizobium fredii GR64]